MATYSLDRDIHSFHVWLSDQCSQLRKQHDPAACLQWLRDFTSVGGFSPIEEQYLLSSQCIFLKEGFKLCNELRHVVQIAAKELFPVWTSVPAQHLQSDPVFDLLCRIKGAFLNVFQVCQTESGAIAASNVCPLESRINSRFVYYLPASVAS
jgi:hypothetical protein